MNRYLRERMSQLLTIIVACSQVSVMLKFFIFRQTPSLAGADRACGLNWPGALPDHGRSRLVPDIAANF